MMYTRFTAFRRAVGAVALAALCAGTVLVPTAPAQAHGHHGCCWGGWGWGLGLGLGAGALWGWPGYYYPYGPYAVEPYYAPGAAPVTILQQPPAAVAAQAPSYYYCSNPKGYYPYVQSCQVQWQQVAATPQGGPQGLTR